MTIEQTSPSVRKPIDTSLPFNDQLESSSPSLKVSLFVLAGIATFIGCITLLVINR
jgi:hypothetical protein